ANEKVQSALQHANHIAEQSKAFEDLARAQAKQVEASAVAKSNSILSEAQTRAQSIIDKVMGHSKEMLRDAEDRQRTLRFQQQQMNGFVAEMHSLMQIAEAARIPFEDEEGEATEQSPSPAYFDAEEVEDDREQVEPVEVTYSEAEVIAVEVEDEGDQPDESESEEKQ
ncbi:MAG TPA: hypothetical protein H9830_01415, partial [Candidatus Agrococcus pullicola]|nr:hypothetical protein [Candidatus Agrococcus pullicola]